MKPDEQVALFHEMLQSLKDQIDSSKPFIGVTPEALLQGPLSDAMSHAGQLALLRRLYGLPIVPENFVKADISSENLTQRQAESVAPDKKWIDAEGNEQNGIA